MTWRRPAGFIKCHLRWNLRSFSSNTVRCDRVLFFSFRNIFRRAMTLWSWLDNRRIVVRFPLGQVNFLFFILSKRILKAHPALCSVSNRGCFLGDGATSPFRGVRRKFYPYLSYFSVGHPVVMKIQKRRESSGQSQHPCFTQ